MKPESMAADTVTPEPATTWSRRLRHFSVDLDVGSGVEPPPGRIGTTLCGEDAYDQERRQYELSRWSDRTVNVDALLPCKKCVRKAGLPDPNTKG